MINKLRKIPKFKFYKRTINKLTSLLVIDFKKVFNTVNIDFLLNKLNHYGVRGTKCCWFKT